jgi:hypothetical protein
MVWYRLHCNAGPGHQSSFEEYVWFYEEPNDADLEDTWEHLFRERRNPVGGCEKVEELPEDIRQDKVREYRYKLNHAQHMLKVLGGAQ